MLSLEIERSAGTAGSEAAAESGSSPARVFHASDCSALVEAAAVAIALALGGAEPPPSPERPELPERAPAPSANDGGADDAGPALASRLSSLGAVLRAEALLDTASLGGMVIGGAAELGVRWRALGLRAYGLGLPSRQIRLAQEQSVELSLWAAGLRGCYRAADGLPQIDVCGGAEVGAFGAAGRNLVDAQARRDLWAAATWGALLGVEVAEHLQAGARLEAVLPLSRERYLVNQNELVHEMSAASVRLALSLAGTLGSD